MKAMTIVAWVTDLLGIGGKLEIIPVWGSWKSLFVVCFCYMDSEKMSVVKYASWFPRGPEFSIQCQH